MEDVLRRLKWPAISLIVAAAVNLLCAGMWLYAMARLILGDAPPGTEEITGDEKLGYRVGQVYSTIVAIGSLLVSPYVIKGALQMMKPKKYNTARAAAILAVVPLSSCCFVIGMPVGLWAMSVLSKPEIKAGFTD
jgi:hypothetical protein